MPHTPVPSSRLRNARLADGRQVDVIIDGGLITEVQPAQSSTVGAAAGDGTTGATTGAGGTVRTAGAGRIVDLTGYVLLPAAAEPHAHLDKSLTSELVPNPTGDLPGAITAWLEFRSSLTVDDIAGRARAGALALLANGVTAIRTHVDVGVGIGLRGVEALLRVRAELAEMLDLQIVALVSRPLVGIEGAENRALHREAMAMGADVVGGSPHVDPDPAGHLRECVALASALGVALDLHADENLDPASSDLERLTAAIRDLHGTPGKPWAHGVTASHCVSLGVRQLADQRRIAEAVSAAGIGVVTLPITNLYLQARGIATAAPRGLTAIDVLRAAGVVVAGGADNQRDPFNPMGRADPMETAALLVVAGHMAPDAAYDAVSTSARSVMALPPVEVVVGSPAELLAIRAESLTEAIGAAGGDRLVWHAGRLVARSQRRIELDPDLETTAHRV